MVAKNILQEYEILPLLPSFMCILLCRNIGDDKITISSAVEFPAFGFDINGNGMCYGWPVHVFCLAFASFYLGTLRVRCPPTPHPTTNQPPIHPIISVNNRRMRTFQVAILCACMARRRMCCYGCTIAPSWGERRLVKVTQQKRWKKSLTKQQIGYNLENTWAMMANRVPN